MYTVYAKQDGAKALYTLATAPTFSKALKAAKPFRDSRPIGWRTGVGGIHQLLVTAEPTEEVADVLLVWQDKAARGEVNPPAWTGSSYCSDDDDEEEDEE